jgi:hypothetical protein
LTGLLVWREKSHRYLTFVGLLFGVAGFIWSSILPVHWCSLGVPGYLCILSSAFFFRYGAPALWYIHSAIKMSSLVKTPMNSDLLEFFDKTDAYLDIIFALSKGNIAACKKNQELSFEKAKDLSIAHDLMGKATISVLVFLVFAMLYALFSVVSQ